MAYFSNSTEGMAFESRWCERCAHGPGEDCQIMSAHALYQGEKGPQEVLDMLISKHPDPSDGLVCSLFFEKPGQTPWD